MTFLEIYTDVAWFLFKFVLVVVPIVVVAMGMYTILMDPRKLLDGFVVVLAGVFTLSVTVTLIVYTEENSRETIQICD